MFIKYSLISIMLIKYKDKNILCFIIIEMISKSLIQIQNILCFVKI